MWSPSLNLPVEYRERERILDIRWIARFSGRAPNAGSNPSSANTRFASGVSSSVIFRSLSNFLSRSSCRSTMCSI